MQLQPKHVQPVVMAGIMAFIMTAFITWLNLGWRPDFLKLGRNVIGDVDKDGIQRALAACLVDFAEQIGTTLVAEGVETVGELKVLTELGISAAQGYLLGRPSVRPKDWASWNGRLDLDGLNRHFAGREQAGEASVASEQH